MAYQKGLQVPYHQQDTPFYCGSASAQMVLASVGAGILDQAVLYTDTHNHTVWDQNLYNALGQKIEWATNPNGLTWTLNDRNGGHYYVEFVLQNEDAASRKIAWTIEHYGVAPCALVMGARHWIVVRGMDLSKAPTSSTDVGYTINGFRINDPWPPVPSSTYWNNPAQPPPPQHSAGDGCGVGPNRGVADQVIAYNTWQNTYMTAANYHAQGHWQGMFVTVCDPDPPPTLRGPSVKRIRRFDGSKIINTDQVSKLALEFVKKGEFIPRDEVWKKALKGVKTAEPVLVQRLDRGDDFYYFVPLVSGEGRRGAVAALAFDARFGDFQLAASFPQPEASIVNVPTSEAVLKKVVNRDFELESYHGKIHIRNDVTIVLPQWVWKPCLESLSPLWPFKMIVSGAQTLYMRLDGQVFTALHDNILGI